MAFTSLPQDILREILQLLSLKDITNLCLVRSSVEIAENRQTKYDNLRYVPN